MAKRSATKDLYVASNTAFLEDNIDNEEDIVYQGKYTSSFVLYATDAEIEKYAKCEDVQLIVPFCDDAGDVESVPVEQTQIGVDSVSGTKSSQYNSGSGYKGTGVKIGIVELKGGKYYETSPQLSSISGGQLKFIANSVTDFNSGDAPYHATMVTSLIVGQEYTADGCTYEGVVPNATVYQVAASGWISAKNALDILVEEGVSVINYSGGSSLLTNEYSVSYDGYIDEFIESTGITFVKSAGNTAGVVTSPGKAYNAITVGNLWSKDYNDETGWHYVTSEYQNNFKIQEVSSYQEASYIANKPDVVAPGSGIEIPLSLSEIKHDTGTSYSAPLVTGIVAQIHQAKPILKSNPTATKAIIIAGANHDVVCIEPQYVWDILFYDNPQKEIEYIRDKTGAGMVNAANSIEIAVNNQYYFGRFNLSANYSGTPIMEDFCNFYVDAGQKMRLVMTYNKIDEASVSESGYENDVNFSVYEYLTDEFVVSSHSVYNNVEIVEFTATEGTRFSVDVFLQSYVPASSTCFLPLSFAGLYIDE